jgi:WD40 repeat protein
LRGVERAVPASQISNQRNEPPAQDSKGKTRIGGSSKTYSTVPPLPKNFVPRPKLVEALREWLLQSQEDQSDNIGLIAVQGMGGIGKTVIAQSLCHDRRVVEAFPDGIAWLAIGKNSAMTVVEHTREIGKVLNDDLSRYDTAVACIHQYQSTIKEKAALIILDDIWQVRDIEQWLATSPRSKVLFTTRDASIGSALGARPFEIEHLSAAEANKFLATWSGTEPKNFPAEADAIIRECGRLPLALAMVGAMLRDKPRALWQSKLELLRNADLKKLKLQFPGYPYPSLFSALAVSIQALDQSDRERYCALAVILEEMPASRIIQETLWGVDKNKAAELAERFMGLSLAQRESNEESLRLHDLQLDYVRAQYEDPTALALILQASRLSWHVVHKDDSQFASQMVGRLLNHAGKPKIRQFLKEISTHTPVPWLRPLVSTLVQPGGDIVRTFEGHSHHVQSVTITRDGRHILSTSSDCTLKLWDIETGHVLRTLVGHNKDVVRAAISPDGQHAISASSDTTLKIWDLHSGRELRTLEGHTGPVSGVAISNDGKRAISSSRDYTLRLWELETGRQLCVMKGHSNAVLDIAMSNDSRRAVSVSYDRTVRLWDVETGRQIRIMRGHSGPVSSVAIFHHGLRAISASSDGTLKIWDLESGDLLNTLSDHSNYVEGVAITPDQCQAVSASGDKTLKIWDLHTCRVIRTLEGHHSYVHGVTVTPDGLRVVSASCDKTLKLWNLHADRQKTQKGHSGKVRATAISRDGLQAISGSEDETIRIWDVRSGCQGLVLKGHTSSVRAVALFAGGQRAISASSDCTLKIWDLGSGKQTRDIQAHSDYIRGIALSLDEQYVVSASWDKTLKIWDLETGRELRRLQGHSSHVQGVALSNDQRLIVSASWDKTLKVWDFESGKEIKTLEGHTGEVDGVAITPDASRAVSASRDTTLKVWELSSGRELWTMSGHSDIVYAVAVSSDGYFAISASADNTVKVWDLHTGSNIATFTCEGPVYCCTISATLTITCGDATGQVHFIQLEPPANRLR